MMNTIIDGVMDGVMDGVANSMMILLAHGSRDESWAENFQAMTQISRKKHVNTRLAFMELNHPLLKDAALEAIELGYQHITILPLFLAKGKHLKHDIPQQLLALEAEYGIKTKLLSPIGEQNELAMAVDQIIERQISE